MSFLATWERIRRETKIQTFIELSELVGTTKQYVSKKKKEDNFPVEWAYKVASEYDLLTEWILTGQGPKRLSEAGYKQNYDFQVLKDLNEWLNELVVGEPHRRDWFLASIEDSFPMFREWKKRREKEESRSDIDPQSNVA